MVRKPGKMYRNLAKKAYTRREYMGGVPGSKIVQFEMGISRRNSRSKHTLSSTSVARYGIPPSKQPVLQSTGG